MSIGSAPIVVPSTHQPFYVDQGQMLTINCSFNYDYYLNMTWVIDFNITGNFEHSGEEIAECYPECVILFWVAFTFEATALTNQRNFQCMVLFDDRNITAEILLVQTFIHSSDPSILGPSEVTAKENTTWSCVCDGGSITVPKITWKTGSGEILTKGIITSVYVTEVDYYNYVYKVTSNLTISPAPTSNNTLDLYCLVFHSVAELHYDGKASKLIVINSRPNRTLKSTNDGSRMSVHIALVFIWTSIVTWARIYAVEIASMNRG
ncbi:hypothetical protein Btru_053774 [Bulinus truncatus]|nr:hypothetical protein Btru_053774 [Bulinus truncatus]